MWQTQDRTQRARRLRSQAKGAEAVLWQMVRARRFEGLKFRRQAPVAGFIADFFCAELRLVIELDGGVHRLREGEDALRDERMEREGFSVIRVGNEAFLANPGDLLQRIRQRARSIRKQPPHPSGSA